MLAPPRGFSQRATSFFASVRQGIHQMPLKRLIQRNPVTPREKYPRPFPQKGKRVDTAIAQGQWLNNARPFPKERVEGMLRRLAPPAPSKRNVHSDFVPDVSEPDTPKGAGPNTSDKTRQEPFEHLPPHSPLVKKRPRGGNPKGSSPHKNPIHNLKQQQRPTPNKAPPKTLISTR